MSFYRVKSEFVFKVPDFAPGIASFDSNHWKKTSLVPDPDYIQSEIVKCVSYSKLLQDNKITEINLLLIATEGYNPEILMGIDFNHVKHCMICFEHEVRDRVMCKSNFIEVIEKLNSYGYQIIAKSYDATAYLVDPKDSIFCDLGCVFDSLSRL